MTKKFWQFTHFIVDNRCAIEQTKETIILLKGI